MEEEDSDDEVDDARSCLVCWLTSPLTIVLRVTVPSAFFSILTTFISGAPLGWSPSVASRGRLRPDDLVVEDSESEPTVEEGTALMEPPLPLAGSIPLTRVPFCDQIENRGF